jgi:hypothetical protein
MCGKLGILAYDELPDHVQDIVDVHLDRYIYEVCHKHNTKRTVRLLNGIFDEMSFDADGYTDIRELDHLVKVGNTLAWTECGGCGIWETPSLHECCICMRDKMNHDLLTRHATQLGTSLSGNNQWWVHLNRDPCWDDSDENDEQIDWCDDLKRYECCSTSVAAHVPMRKKWRDITFLTYNKIIIVNGHLMHCSKLPVSTCDACGLGESEMWSCCVCYLSGTTPLRVSPGTYGFDICYKCMKETPWPIVTVVP